ncbi:MAG TPA: c-type cytochrome domain-containing protein, partial [Bacteroidia bacterium]|nr:c-type cytochrome domain-containing protein [Bacteroidia bacterium]
NCNTAGCHSGTSPAGGLNLEPANAYAQLTSHQGGYIDTLHPEFSLLYSQLISTTTPMPPTGKLDDCTIKLVLKWIQQKAKNN